MKLNKWLNYSFVSCLLVFSVGCSTVTTTEGMTPEVQAVSHGAKQATAGLMVSGELGFLNKENLVQALSDTVSASGIFAGLDADNPSHLLEVVITRTSKPAVGFSFLIEMDADWKLFLLSDKSLVWSETINSTYKGGGEGGFVGMNRFRVATEGAARENIRMGIEALQKAELNLDPDI